MFFTITFNENMPDGFFYTNASAQCGLNVNITIVSQAANSVVICTDQIIPNVTLFSFGVM
jgi:hypothetical protein